MKSIFLLRDMENGIPLTNKMSAVKNTVLLRLAISLVNLIRSEATTVGLPLDIIDLQGTDVLAVFDLVVFYQPLEIRVQRIQQFSVKLPCCFSSFSVTFGKCLLFLFERVH